MYDMMEVEPIRALVPKQRYVIGGIGRQVIDYS